MFCFISYILQISQKAKEQNVSPKPVFTTIISFGEYSPQKYINLPYRLGPTNHGRVIAYKKAPLLFLSMSSHPDLERKSVKSRAFLMGDLSAVMPTILNHLWPDGGWTLCLHFRKFTDL